MDRLRGRRWLRGGTRGGGMNRSDKGALRALVLCHLSGERECATSPPPSSDLRSPLHSVTPECCFQACSAQLEDESLNFSLLFLEWIPFLCSRASTPKGTLVSASPPHEVCRRFDQTIWWAVKLIRIEEWTTQQLPQFWTICFVLGSIIVLTPCVRNYGDVQYVSAPAHLLLQAHSVWGHSKIWPPSCPWELLNDIQYPQMGKHIFVRFPDF